MSDSPSVIDSEEKLEEVLDDLPHLYDEDLSWTHAARSVVEIAARTVSPVNIYNAEERRLYTSESRARSIARTYDIDRQAWLDTADLITSKRSVLSIDESSEFNDLPVETVSYNPTYEAGTIYERSDDSSQGNRNLAKTLGLTQSFTGPTMLNVFGAMVCGYRAVCDAAYAIENVPRREANLQAISSAENRMKAYLRNPDYETV